MPARKQTQVSIVVNMQLGHVRANICVVVEGADSARHEFIFTRSATHDQVVTHGIRTAPTAPWRWRPAGSEPISSLGLNLGTTNTIRLDIHSGGFRIISNGTTVMSREVATDWDLRAYGFGFRDGDVDSVVQGFIVRALDDSTSQWQPSRHNTSIGPTESMPPGVAASQIEAAPVLGVWDSANALLRREVDMFSIECSR